MLCGGKLKLKIRRRFRRTSQLMAGWSMGLAFRSRQVLRNSGRWMTESNSSSS